MDIESKIMSLKISWLPRLMADNKVSDLFDLYLRQSGLKINTILRMNFRDKDSCDFMKTLPNFYQDIILMFNTCKNIKPIHKLANVEMLSQVIWGNEYFKTKNKCLFFINWIPSDIIYVKDLFDANGEWISEKEILNKLSKKYNWIAKYSLIKKIVGKQIKKFDGSIGKYIQNPMLKCTSFYALGKYWGIQDIKSNVMYGIAVEKTVLQPYSRWMWEKLCPVNLNASDWTETYKSNICHLKHKKFDEFKFKILHDILPSRNKVSKWRKDVSPNCEYCNEPEDTSHMLYKCERVLDIWKRISQCLKKNIKLKHVVFGLKCDNIANTSIHLGIVIISYAIYAVWCKCSVESVNYSNINLHNEIKKQLYFYSSFFEGTMTSIGNRHFTKVMKCMIEHL